MPAVYEHHLVQHRLDIGDKVRGNDDRRLRVVVFDNGVEDIVPRGGVNAADRLIEQIELGAAAHDHDKLRLLLCALGHLLDVLLRIDAQSPQHILRLCPVEVLIEIAEKVHELPGVHPVGQILLIRQV